MFFAANCLFNRKRRASPIDDGDLRHSILKENDEMVLGRKRRNEDIVDPLSAEADRRDPNLTEECNTINEVDISCNEDNISLAETLPPVLSSDGDSDSSLSERRYDSSFENDIEEDLNLHLELTQPLSNPQSSGSGIILE